MSWVGVITDAGRDLFASYAQSGLTLSINRVETGTGYESTDANRRARTALVSKVDEGVVESMKSVGSGVQFGMRIGAYSGDSPYSMKEIGLIVDATGGGGTTSTLVAYFNLSEGVDIPIESSFPDFSYILSATLAIDNTTPFTLTVDPDAYVSQSTLASVKAEIEDELDEKVAIDQGLSKTGMLMVVDVDGKVVPALFIMEGATGSNPGKKGLVPAPSVAERLLFLCGDGTWKAPTDTKYTAGSGLSLAGTIFSLANSGAVAGQYGMSEDATGNDGTQINIPCVTIDSFGRVTNIVNKKFTAKNTQYSAGSGLTLANGMFSLGNSGATPGSYGMSENKTGSDGTTINIPYITIDASGRITSIVNKVFTVKDTQYSAGSGLSLNGTVFSLGNSGVVAGSYGPTGNVTGNNGTKVKIPQIVVDAFGRVTGVVEREFTAVNTNTTYSAGNGLTLNGTTFAMSGSYSGNFTATKVYNAVWNDYAEFRKGVTVNGGYCLMECPDGYMRKSTKRLQAGCRLTSDTFGSCMGETDKAKTPIAVAGRVLAYVHGDTSDFKVGDAVCSAPGGKISKMSRREIRKYPDRIIGIVSEIPNYKMWQGGSPEEPVFIPVDGRIWVYVR